MYEWRYQLLILLVTVPFVVMAMLCDARHRRLPNQLSVAIAVTAFLLHSVIGGLGGLGSAALGLVVGFALMLPFYLCHMLGAGDVKFLAALGAFLGFPWVLHALVASGILAGVVYAVSLLGKGRESAPRRWAYIAAKLSSFKLLVSDFASHRTMGHKTLPYGVYLGLAAIGTSLYRVCDAL